MYNFLISFCFENAVTLSEVSASVTSLTKILGVFDVKTEKLTPDNDNSERGT